MIITWTWIDVKASLYCVEKHCALWLKPSSCSSLDATPVAGIGYSRLWSFLEVSSCSCRDLAIGLLLKRGHSISSLHRKPTASAKRPVSLWHNIACLPCNNRLLVHALSGLLFTPKCCLSLLSVIDSLFLAMESETSLCSGPCPLSCSRILCNRGRTGPWITGFLPRKEKKLKWWWDWPQKRHTQI